MLTVISEVEQLSALCDNSDELQLELRVSNIELLEAFSASLSAGQLKPERLVELSVCSKLDGKDTTPIPFHELSHVSTLKLDSCQLVSPAPFNLASVKCLQLTNCSLKLDATELEMCPAKTCKLETASLINTNIAGVDILTLGGPGASALTTAHISLDEDHAEDFPSRVRIYDCPRLDAVVLHLCWIFDVELAGSLLTLESLSVDAGQHGKHELKAEHLVGKSIYLQKRFPPELAVDELDVVQCLHENEARGGTPLGTVVDWLRANRRLPEGAPQDAGVLRVAVSRALQKACAGSKLFAKGYNKGTAYVLKPPTKKKIKDKGLDAVIGARHREAAAGSAAEGRLDRSEEEERRGRDGGAEDEEGAGGQAGRAADGARGAVGVAAKRRRRA